MPYRRVEHTKICLKVQMINIKDQRKWSSIYGHRQTVPGGAQGDCVSQRDRHKHKGRTHEHRCTMENPSVELRTE